MGEDDPRTAFTPAFDGAPEETASSHGLSETERQSAGRATRPRPLASAWTAGAGVDAALAEPVGARAEAARHEPRVSISQRADLDSGSNGVEPPARPAPAVVSPAQEAASARARDRELQSANVAPARGVPRRESSPLSATSLAHRAGGPAEEPTVVHVTIGRIEVLAHSAPPPARSRGPVPRQPTVALADYLRGEAGGRR